MAQAQVYFGIDTINELPLIIKNNGYKNIYLVRGERSFENSPVKKIVSDLSADISFREFYGFDHNPNIVDVYRAVKEIGSELPDVILAVGGGSAIDVAKLIRSALLCGCDEVQSLAMKGNKVDLAGLPLIAVPTTAGTGSEVTSFAVVYIDGVKHSLAGAGVLPDVVIVDPKLTENLPAKVTADSGLDAFCQGIESYWSVKSTIESREYALKAIKASYLNLHRAVINPNQESRLQMCVASHNAGKAINLTTTTAAHAVSYPLTTHFGIAHGHAVALTLPEFILLNQSGHETFEQRFNQSLDYEEYDRRIRDLCDALDCNSPQELAVKVYELIDSLGLETDLRKHGVNEISYDLIISEVNLQRLGNNPTVITEAIIKDVLKQPNLPR